MLRRGPFFRSKRCLRWGGVGRRCFSVCSTFGASGSGGVGWLGWGGAGFAYGRLPSSGVFSSTRESICIQRFAWWPSNLYGLRFNSRRSSMLERVLALRACPAMFVSSQSLRCLQCLWAYKVCTLVLARFPTFTFAAWFLGKKLCLHSFQAAVLQNTLIVSIGFLGLTNHVPKGCLLSFRSRKLYFHYSSRPHYCHTH